MDLGTVLGKFREKGSESRKSERAGLCHCAKGEGVSSEILQEDGANVPSSRWRTRLTAICDQRSRHSIDSGAISAGWMLAGRRWRERAGPSSAPTATMNATWTKATRSQYAELRGAYCSSLSQVVPARRKWLARVGVPRAERRTDHCSWERGG